MKRPVGIAAATVAAVLVAGGTAAALNARVLDASSPAPADSILASATPVPDATGSDLAAPSVSLTPTPDDSDDPAAPSVSPSRTSTRTAHASPTRTASRTSSPRTSSPRPSAGESDDSGHGGSDDGSPQPSKSSDD
ncbi:MAG TPA: hypothetical protein VFL59_06900 [Candidatus Nanopelagicales bacterium]|nr:hypothetical protein [Candidatus Nanopelagicales bacterium]